MKAWIYGVVLLIGAVLGVVLYIRRRVRKSKRLPRPPMASPSGLSMERCSAAFIEPFWTAIDSDRRDTLFRNFRVKRLLYEIDNPNLAMMARMDPDETRAIGHLDGAEAHVVRFSAPTVRRRIENIIDIVQGLLSEDTDDVYDAVRQMDILLATFELQFSDLARDFVGNAGAAVIAASTELYWRVSVLLFLAGEVGRFYFGVLSVGAAEDEVDIESVLRRELSPLFSHCVSETPRSMFYDAANGAAVQAFRPVSAQTQCLFAEKAKMWGAPEYDESLSLQDNVVRALPTLALFVNINEIYALDGFVFHIPLPEVGESIESLGEALNVILSTISNRDPAGLFQMHREKTASWQFTYDMCEFFVTTFAPCYGEGSSRFNFGLPSTFVLFQPNLSFGRHGVPTHSRPGSMRDRIRKNFDKAGRGYGNPEPPVIHEYVRPHHEDDEIPHWWQPEYNDVVQ